MSGKAAKITLTEEQQSILQQIYRSRTAPRRLVQRVGIILLAFAGWFNADFRSPLSTNIFCGWSRDIPGFFGFSWVEC